MISLIYIDLSNNYTCCPSFTQHFNDPYADPGFGTLCPPPSANPWSPSLSDWASPIGTRFFSARAFDVVDSEICWVGLPSLGLALAILVGRRLGRRKMT